MRHAQEEMHSQEKEDHMGKRGTNNVENGRRIQRKKRRKYT